MKCYTILTDGIPEAGMTVVVEGSLLRLFFDYEKQKPVTTEEGEEIIGENHYACENVDIMGSRDYGSLVSAIVAARYSDSDVTAIIVNHELAKDSAADISDEKREEYMAEFAQFQEWRSHAKEIAKKAISLM